ncbi:hypothetical protein E2562_034988 [Oryza meyeriana var. granulata]|uniref:Uncharacterized protein n=1 Tax=Oryza meyeriana var. granulata TaxID=110450 RepID=A0A6G1CB48_9ORYZ|nr:hypothetical protein E2562_034988 [Oryza meyeriana var. granulata]
MVVLALLANPVPRSAAPIRTTHMTAAEYRGLFKFTFSSATSGHRPCSHMEDDCSTDPFRSTSGSGWRSL